MAMLNLSPQLLLWQPSSLFRRFEGYSVYDVGDETYFSDEEIPGMTGPIVGRYTIEKSCIGRFCWGREVVWRQIDAEATTAEI